MKKSIKLLSCLALVSTLAACTGSTAVKEKNGTQVYKNTEVPNYNVVQTIDDIEIRQYPSMLLAQTTVIGTESSAPNKGFKVLADYIFGNNLENTKIAMTSPVTISPVSGKADSKEWLITFKMPSKYTVETLPKPRNNDVVITIAKPQKLAAIEFSGLMSEDKTQKYYNMLLQQLAATDYEVKDGYRIAAYDNPYSTLPWNRRNEVLIELKD